MADDKDTIQARMLSDIPDQYDKNEGSFYWDNTRSVAIELESKYSEQESILDQGFAETAADVYLERKVAEQGISRKLATYASGTVKITGNVGTTIDADIKVASDALTFTVKETKVIPAAGYVEVLAQCDTAGSSGNVPTGAIKSFPVTIAGLTLVTNEQPFTGGYDDETDEALRKRYFTKVQKPATSGNVYQYEQWAEEVSGVGGAKVFPLHAGPGTVKVVIMDANKKAAPSALITGTDEYIESVRPIGATVTVASATEVAINISVTSVLAEGFTIELVTPALETMIEEYLQSVAFVGTMVSYAIIGSKILETTGIEDYSNLLVNGGTVSITLGDEDIPVLGTVTAAL